MASPILTVTSFWAVPIVIGGFERYLILSLYCGFTRNATGNSIQFHTSRKPFGLKLHGAVAGSHQRTIGTDYPDVRRRPADC